MIILKCGNIEKAITPTLKMTELSIIIPSYDRENDLKRCIESVLKQDYKNFDIIIINNDSHDGTLKYLFKLKKKLKNKLRLIINKDNVGASEARNQALRIVDSEYVLFLDSDTEFKYRNTISKMLDIYRNDKNGKIGQLGGEIIHGKIRLGKTEINQDGLFIWVDKVKMKKAEYVATSNCMMKTSLLKKIGGFDPYYIYGYEDNDLGWRVRENGYDCIIDDRVVIYHHVSLAGRVGSFFRFHKNRVRFLVKKSNILVLMFLPLIDFVISLKLAPERAKEFSEKPIEDIAWFDQEKKKEMMNEKDDGRIKKILILGFNYYLNLFKAYLWNIFHLRQTLNVRFINHNFI